jgi:hypothetical protein
VVQRGGWLSGVLLIGLALLVAAAATWSLATVSKRTTEARPSHSTSSTTLISPPPAAPPRTGATSTTEAPTADACPPGCSVPSNYDAITVMASLATAVVIASAQDVQDNHGVISANFISNHVLQGDENGNVYSVPLDGFSVRAADSTYPIEEGMTYLVFMSFNRGGSCLAALYSYDSDSQVASLIDETYDGDPNLIPLPGRTLPIPQTMTLAYVEARMHPTGGVVVPLNSAEWYCPGP